MPDTARRQPWVTDRKPPLYDADTLRARHSLWNHASGPTRDRRQGQGVTTGRPPEPGLAPGPLFVGTLTCSGMASAQAARIGVVEPGVDAKDPGLGVPPGPGEPSGRSSAPMSPTTRKVAVGDAPSMLAEWGLLGGPGWSLAGLAYLASKLRRESTKSRV